jgi:glycosyltransferase involved in cell wall biosynthesis
MLQPAVDGSAHDAPLVTVILPTNGRAEYLREAIQSLLKQSFTQFVVLIGDNANSAECAAIASEWSDSRINYIAHPENLGAQGNWLELIRRAQTPLVATLHDDDAWHSNFLARLVPPLLADETLAMSFGDYALVDQRGQPMNEATRTLSGNTHRDRLPEGPMQLPLEAGLRLTAVWNAPNPAICAVIRRLAVLETEFPPAAAPLYDLWLVYQLIKRHAALYFVRDKLTDYRIHPHSASSAGFAVPEDFIFNTILSENADAGPVTDEIRQYWARIRWGRAVKKMTSSATRCDSQHEFRAAAALLQNRLKRSVATLAGHSDTAWAVLRFARGLKARRYN